MAYTDGALGLVLVSAKPDMFQYFTAGEAMSKGDPVEWEASNTGKITICEITSVAPIGVAMEHADAEDEQVLVCVDPDAVYELHDHDSDLAITDIGSWSDYIKNTDTSSNVSDCNFGSDDIETTQTADNLIQVVGLSRTHGASALKALVRLTNNAWVGGIV